MLGLGREGDPALSAMCVLSAMSVLSGDTVGRVLLKKWSFGVDEPGV